MKGIMLATLVAACAAPPASDDTDADLDADPELAALLADDTPEQPPDAAIPIASDASVECTKERFLHFANYSWIPPLSECVAGACSNGCWGSEQRTSGFTCEYKATAAGYVVTDDNGGPFAAYNEIKSLNAHDATAVANCRARGGRPVKTYTVWNGVGWNDEGIASSVAFAEIYGTQADGSSKFWTWYNHARGHYAPMGNVSPETHLSEADVKNLTARLCSATRDEWLGLYFYDGDAADGAGMSDWKARAIIRGMNYCTTH